MNATRTARSRNFKMTERQISVLVNKFLEDHEKKPAPAVDPKPVDTQGLYFVEDEILWSVH